MKRELEEKNDQTAVQTQHAYRSAHSAHPYQLENKDLLRGNGSRGPSVSPKVSPHNSPKVFRQGGDFFYKPSEERNSPSSQVNLPNQVSN